MKKCIIENKYAFSTYFSIYIGRFTSFTTSRSSIDINTISIFNNQPYTNHKDMQIKKITLFVNDVVL